MRVCPRCVKLCVCVCYHRRRHRRVSLREEKSGCARDRLRHLRHDWSRRDAPLSRNGRRGRQRTVSLQKDLIFSLFPHSRLPRPSLSLPVRSHSRRSLLILSIREIAHLSNDDEGKRRTRGVRRRRRRSRKIFAPFLTARSRARFAFGREDGLSIVRRLFIYFFFFLFETVRETLDVS